MASASKPVTERSKRALRLPAVLAIVPYSRPTIYRKMSQGTFPKPIQLGDNAVAWLEHEILEWLEARIDESRKAA